MLVRTLGLSTWQSAYSAIKCFVFKWSFFKRSQNSSIGLLRTLDYFETKVAFILDICKTFDRPRRLSFVRAECPNIHVTPDTSTSMKLSFLSYLLLHGYSLYVRYIPLLARATPSAHAVAGYLVYKFIIYSILQFLSLLFVYELIFCMQDTFARATHSAYAAGRPSATIGYLVYKLIFKKF